SDFTCKKHLKRFGGFQCCAGNPHCPDGRKALIRHGKVVQCFIHGSPCMVAGYSCQRARDGSLQCCSIAPISAECPPGYRSAMSLINGGFIPCSDRFDFTSAFRLFTKHSFLHKRNYGIISDKAAPCVHRFNSLNRCMLFFGNMSRWETSERSL
ncbi:hypothetical protein Tcan_04450, partial [Toxocara canis]